jgi:hypothetical protein
LDRTNWGYLDDHVTPDLFDPARAFEPRVMDPAILLGTQLSSAAYFVGRKYRLTAEQTDVRPNRRRFSDEQKQRSSPAPNFRAADFQKHAADCDKMPVRSSR